MLANTQHTQMVIFKTSPTPYRVRVIYPSLFGRGQCTLSNWRAFKTLWEAKKFINEVEENLGDKDV